MIRFLLLLIFSPKFKSRAHGTDTTNITRQLQNEYPLLIQCSMNETILHVNNSILFDFDVIEVTPNKTKIKVEMLIHDRNEYDYAMTHPDLEKCNVDVSKTNQYHDDAIQAISNSKTFMSTESTSFEKISPGYSCFRSINGMYQTIQYLKETYSKENIIQVETIGKSYLKSIDENNGDDLTIVKISNFNATNKDDNIEKSDIMIISGIHAREYAPPELSMRYIEYIVQNYQTNADIATILNTTTLHFLLYSNPDGRRIAEEQPMLYVRKNRNTKYENDCSRGSYGIDLNRNFPFMWGGLGASSRPCSETFRGPSSMSEPETQAIVNYASKIFPPNQGSPKKVRRRHRFKPYPLTNSGIFLDIHSFGQLNMYPWSYENRNTPNANSYIAVSTKMSYFNDHKNAGPMTQAYLYEAAGDTTDFMYGALGALSFTLEVGNKFYERCTFFRSKYAPKNIDALLYISKLSVRPYALAFGPDVVTIDHDVSTISTTTYLCISAIISDRAYATDQKTNLTYITGIQNVVEAFVIVDEYPYYYYDKTKNRDDYYTSYKMVQSGEKDEWNIVIPLSNLSDGKHVFHIYAIDSSGDVGPLSSRFFYICKDDTSECPPAVDSDAPKICKSIACSWNISRDTCLESSNLSRCGWDDNTKICVNVPRRRRGRNRKNINK